MFRKRQALNRNARKGGSILYSAFKDKLNLTFFITPCSAYLVPTSWFWGFVVALLKCGTRKFLRPRVCCASKPVSNHRRLDIGRQFWSFHWCLWNLRCRSPEWKFLRPWRTQSPQKSKGWEQHPCFFSTTMKPKLQVIEQLWWRCSFQNIIVLIAFQNWIQVLDYM